MQENFKSVDHFDTVRIYKQVQTTGELVFFNYDTFVTVREREKRLQLNTHWAERLLIPWPQYLFSATPFSDALRTIDPFQVSSKPFYGHL